MRKDSENERKRYKIEHGVRMEGAGKAHVKVVEASWRAHGKLSYGNLMESAWKYEEQNVIESSGKAPGKLMESLLKPYGKADGKAHGKLMGSIQKAYEKHMESAWEAQGKLPESARKA